MKQRLQWIKTFQSNKDPSGSVIGEETTEPELSYELYASDGFHNGWSNRCSFNH